MIYIDLTSLYVTGLMLSNERNHPQMVELFSSLKLWSLQSPSQDSKNHSKFPKFPSNPSKNSDHLKLLCIFLAL